MCIAYVLAYNVPCTRTNTRSVIYPVVYSDRPGQMNIVAGVRVCLLFLPPGHGPPRASDANIDTYRACVRVSFLHRAFVWKQKAYF